MYHAAGIARGLVIDPSKFAYTLTAEDALTCNICCSVADDDFRR